MPSRPCEFVPELCDILHSLLRWKTHAATQTLDNSLHTQQHKCHICKLSTGVLLWLACTTAVTGAGNDLRGAPNHVDQLD